MCLVDVASINGSVVFIPVGGPYAFEMELEHNSVGLTFIVWYVVDAGGAESNWSAVCHDVIEVQLYVEDRMYWYMVESVGVVVNILQRQERVPCCAIAENTVDSCAARALHSFLESTSALGGWWRSGEGSANHIFNYFSVCGFDDRL